MRQRLAIATDLLATIGSGQVRLRDSLVRIADVGHGSFLFVAVIGAFIGMNIALQGYISLHRVGSLDLLGAFVARAALREVAPIAVIAFAAAKVGSEIAASIAAMKDRGELDALTVTGIDPLAYVAGPWFVGLCVALPLLVVVGDVAAALAAYLVAVHQLGVSPAPFLDSLRANAVPVDLVVGMLKGLIIGLLVAVIASTAGFRARPGIPGIARATNRSAVISFVTATVVNFLVTGVVYGL
jgi:phospholipid/cholesterol/gamma-HCH transport system permease protein